MGLVTAEVRLGELAKVQADEIDLAALQAANVVPRNIKRVRIMLSGEISRPVTVKGDKGTIKVTKGAAAAISQAGGTVQE